jgi:hypothetical protein
MFPLPDVRGLKQPVATFELHRVETREDWREVRALRHRALRCRGDLPEGAEGFPDDGFDTALNSATFLLTLQGRTAGTTRTSVSSASRRWPLPSAEPFRREIEAAIGWDATLVEASLNVIEPTLPGDSRDALFHLLKAPMLRCALEGADWLIVAVPESQIGFHRRMFNMEILSGSEHCPRLALPRVLMGLDYRRQAPVLHRRIPALAPSEADERVLA